MPDYSLKEFNKAMDRAVKTLTHEQLPLFMKKIGFDLLVAVMRKTPVDTGHARRGWRLTIDQKATDASPPGDPIAEAMKVMSGHQGPIRVLYVTNNVEYIVELEYGHSQQAPQGMLAISLEEVRRAVG